MEFTVPFGTHLSTRNIIYLFTEEKRIASSVIFLIGKARDLDKTWFYMSTKSMCLLFSQNRSALLPSLTDPGARGQTTGQGQGDQPWVLEGGLWKKWGRSPKAQSPPQPQQTDSSCTSFLSLLFQFAVTKRYTWIIVAAPFFLLQTTNHGPPLT